MVHHNQRTLTKTGMFKEQPFVHPPFPVTNTSENGALQSHHFPQRHTWLGAPFFWRVNVTPGLQESSKLDHQATARAPAGPWRRRKTLRGTQMFCFQNRDRNRVFCRQEREPYQTHLTSFPCALRVVCVWTVAKLVDKGSVTGRGLWPSARLSSLCSRVF